MNKFLPTLLDKSYETKLLIKNIIGSFGVKGLAVVVGLITTPVYMNYFSDMQVLGIWFTLISMLNWILNFDLGIGNGLRNKLVIALSKNDRIEVKKYISSGYIVIGMLSLIAIIIGNFFIKSCDWNDILKISSNVISDKVLTRCISILYVGVITQFFLRIITSILYALQKVILPSLLTVSSTILILIYMIIYKSTDIQANLINLSYANILTVNIPLLLVTVYVFTGSMKDSIPRIKYFVKDYAVSIMKLGGMFFWIQISLMIINSTSQFLITWIYGAEYVVEYQIYYKLFYLFVTLFSLITNPVWSAVGKAWVDNKIIWIDKIFKKLMLLALIGSLICLCFIIILQPIINIWLGSKAIKVNYFYAITFMIEVSIIMFTYAATCIANGINDLKTQFICNTLAAVLKIPMVYLLSFFINDWIGVELVNIIIILPCAIIQPFVIKKVLRKN